MNRKPAHWFVALLVVIMQQAGTSSFQAKVRCAEPAAAQIKEGNSLEPGSPAAPHDDPSEESAARTFRDISGKYSVRAVFVDEIDGKVRLRKSNGDTISIPIGSLSPADKQWIGQRAAKSLGNHRSRSNAAGLAEKGGGPSLSDNATQPTVKPTDGVSHESIEYSLSLLAEARKCLSGVKNSADAKRLEEDINRSEEIFKLLVRVKEVGLGPLRLHIQERHADFGRPAWVRTLCAADLPKEAEELAQDSATQAQVKPFPLWCVGRYYANRGNREAAIRVLSQAATMPGMVSVNIDGSVSDNSMLLVAFPRTSYIDGIVSVSKNLRQPYERFAVLLVLAHRCETDGKLDKAKEILASVPRVFDAVVAGIPAALHSRVTVPSWMKLSIAYRKIDSKKSDEFAARSLEGARNIRDTQVAANAMHAVAGDKLAPITEPMPNNEQSKKILLELARGFRDGDDTSRARAAFQFYRDVEEHGVSSLETYWGACRVAVELARWGKYVESAEIVRSLPNYPKGEIPNCLMEAKLPANAEEARNFVRAYRDIPFEYQTSTWSTKDRMFHALVLAGEIEEARKIKSDSISLAGRLAAANRALEAEKELAGISDPTERVRAMVSIADGFFFCQNLPEAIHYLDLAKAAVPSGDYACDACLGIALACVKAGRFADAVRIGARTKDLQRGRIIDELSRRGRWDDVQSLAGNRCPPLVFWTDYLREMCRRKQADALFAAMQPRGSNAEVDFRNIADIARNWAIVADPKIVSAWARKLKSPAHRSAALIAIAKVNALADDPLVLDTAPFANFPSLF